jgi:hypothetical protein
MFHSVPVPEECLGVHVNTGESGVVGLWYGLGVREPAVFWLVEFRVPLLHVIDIELIHERVAPVTQRLIKAVSGCRLAK